MNNLLKILLAVLMVTATSLPVAAQSPLVINELMQSNIDEVFDDLNDFPDSWVELYNTTSEPISLANYKIGTKINENGQPVNAWQLPSNVVVPAYGYQLVYCDKSYDKLVEDLSFKVGLSNDDKERLKLHTNFRLESGKGCVVYLFKGGVLDESASMVDSLKKQPAPNIAFGRELDGSAKWGYELVPTPGSANGGGLTKKKILGQPIFSDSGFVKTSPDPLELTISLPEDSPEGTRIYYTTNGKEPTIYDYLYEGPLYIDRTTVVRAKTFCDGYLSPRSNTQSYIFLDRALTLPVISIVTDDNYLYHPSIGIFPNNDTDYRRDHDNWRRPINFEYFEGEGTKGILNQLCETRVAGGFSRSFDRKTLIIYANKRFGEKMFKHEFFPDQKPGLKNYKSLSLRNAGNDYDYLYMRDAMTQRLMGTNTDLDWQAWSPTMVFINGEYYAMLNIRERAEEDNIYANYDGLEDLDLIENWDNLKEGDMNNWNQFSAFYHQNGHTMAEYEKWMDCHEFMNLMMMNLFYSNLDFPGGNIVAWRPRTEGGRWRWIAKDVDYAMGYSGGGGSIPYTFRTLEWLYNPNYDQTFNWGANGSEWTLLFRQLMNDPTFRNEFIERYAIYTGDFMNYDGMHRVWDPMYEKIKEELYPFCVAINNLALYVNYESEMAYVDNWIRFRTDEFTDQLCSFYGLESPLPLTIPKNIAVDTLTFNDHKLSQGSYQGRYFKGHPIKLKAVPAEDNIITGWLINQDGAETTVAGAELNWMMPNCNYLTIEPICKLKGDFDNNGIVDQADVDLLVSAIMSNTTSGGTTEYDLNNDKKVNAADLVKLVSIVNK